MSANRAYGHMRTRDEAPDNHFWQFSCKPTRAIDTRKYRTAESRVHGAGLITTVLPIANAGAIFQASINSGKFHGMIWPTTPTGSYPAISKSNSYIQASNHSARADSHVVCPLTLYGRNGRAVPGRTCAQPACA